MTAARMDSAPTRAGDKAQLQGYFDGVGFERWAAIYGDQKLSAIRRSIRTGHNRMLATASDWLLEGGAPSTLLDAGCGTGLFSLALAQQGCHVTGVDIAPRMVAAAQAGAAQLGVSTWTHFQVGDMEQITGRFDAVVCFDVLVHYPRESFRRLLHHLSGLSEGPLLFTFAPYNHLFALLHWVGGHFPQSQRRTEIQMIRRRHVEQVLAECGRRVRRSTVISHGFYHVTLVEAVPVPAHSGQSDDEPLLGHQFKGN